MEQKFLQHLHLSSESSTGAKVLELFATPRANVARKETSMGAKILSMVFSLPETKVQRNEKASYRLHIRSGYVYGSTFTASRKYSPTTIFTAITSRQPVVEVL